MKRMGMPLRHSVKNKGTSIYSEDISASNWPCGSESHSVVPDSLWPHGLYSPWNSPGKNTGVDSPFPSPGDLPNPGIEPRSPSLQADSWPAEPQRKPKNTEMGSLSLLQGIFPTQGSNRGLLHCRQILYQLSYEGSYPVAVGYSFCLITIMATDLLVNIIEQIIVGTLTIFVLLAVEALLNSHHTQHFSANSK